MLLHVPSEFDPDVMRYYDRAQSIARKAFSQRIDHDAVCGLPQIELADEPEEEMTEA